jgi:hypothetical protein
MRPTATLLLCAALCGCEANPTTKSSAPPATEAVAPPAVFDGPPASAEKDIFVSKVEARNPLLSVLAGDLIAEYEKSEVAADAKYKGKYIQVIGVIKGIRKRAKNLIGSRYIKLEAGGRYNSPFSVQCFFSTELDRTNPDLMNWHVVAIRGTCGGKDSKSKNVLLTDCTVRRGPLYDEDRRPMWLNDTVPASLTRK